MKHTLRDKNTQKKGAEYGIRLSIPSSSRFSGSPTVTALCVVMRSHTQVQMRTTMLLGVHPILEHCS